MSAFEEILALIGMGSASGASAAAPAMTGLAGMGPEVAAAGVPAFSAGTEASAGAKGGGTSGVLGKMTKDISAKDAMELMMLAQQNRGSGMPGVSPLPGGGGGGGTQPSVRQFLQLLQSRQPPQLRLGG